jgi:LacI family transcriptional regulator
LQKTFSEMATARRGAVSILEVARLAGVSPATVSRVLAGQRRHIAPGTRARVQAAVAQLDYTPNALARSLSTRRFPVLAAILHDIADAYFGEVTGGVESVAAEHDHLVIVCNWLRDPHRLIRYLKLLRTMRVAGVLFCGSGPVSDHPAFPEISRLVELLRRDGTRLLALSVQAIDMPVLTIDNREAARLAVDHLVSRGHRRIGHLAGPPLLLTARLRAEGYTNAMRAHGLDPSPEWLEWCGVGPAETYEGGLRLLQRAPELTAVFATDDQAAMAAIAAAEHRGLTIPADLSVVGIDDVPGLPVRPALTTVAIPMRRIGEEGTRLILRHARAQRGLKPTVQFVPVRLVERDTVAGPRDQTSDYGRPGAP